MFFVKSKFSVLSDKFLKMELLQNEELSSLIGIDESQRSIRYSFIDGIGVLHIDTPNSKVNVLCNKVMNEFKIILNWAREKPEVLALVLLSGKRDSTIVGADISLLKNCQSVEVAIELCRSGQEIVNAIETYPKPVVMGVHGLCLGGGLEVLLGCHYRIAVSCKQTLIGLPEVLLGVIPGMGGTQRLPRTIPLYDALDMMLVGRKIRSEKAKAIGLIDAVISECGTCQETCKNLEREALQAAKALATGHLVVRRTLPFLQRLIHYAFDYRFIRNILFERCKTTVLKRTFGLYPAPLNMIEVVKKGFDDGIEVGYQAEAEAFGRLVMSSESRALISLFHGQTKCKKNRTGTKPQNIKNIAILGTGLMACGIAHISLEHCFSVTMKGRSNDSISEAEFKIHSSFDGAIKRMKITDKERDFYLSLLDTCTAYSKLGESDLVVEAVAEDLEVKQRVLKECEKVIPSHCIYASNTSSLSISRIAAASSRRNKVIGMHYFMPVDKMKLLEVVATEWSSPEAVATAVSVGIKQGKIVIVVKDSPGFYTVRILAALLLEAMDLLQQFQEITRCNDMCRRAGFPMGLVSVVDEIGLDVAYNVAVNLTNAFGARFSNANLDMVKEMLEEGCFGRKSGKGFFVYNSTDPTADQKWDREENSTAINILAKHKICSKAEFSDTDVHDRLLTRFVNEAVRCLQEGVIASPCDGDIGAVFGIGFPPFLGGPFHYVDTVGADVIVSKLHRFETVFGERFSPCSLLLKHAADLTLKFHN